MVHSLLYNEKNNGIKLTNHKEKANMPNMPNTRVSEPKAVIIFYYIISKVLRGGITSPRMAIVRSCGKKQDIQPTGPVSTGRKKLR